MAHPQNSPRGLFSKNVLLPVVSSKPSTRIGPGAIKAISNSTGKALVINTTGTTWRYITTTSVLV